MDNSHNHGHWFVIGALFSVTMFGALSVMEMNAKRIAQHANDWQSYQPTPEFTVWSEPLMIVIPLLMFLIVALAATKWWYER